MNLPKDKTLACASKRKTGIIPIDRFAGVDAVCLIALSDFDTPLDKEMVEISELINRYITNTGAVNGESGSELSDDLAGHVEAPIEWHLGNFSRYVKEHGIEVNELQMMMTVAMGRGRYWRENSALARRDKLRRPTC